MEKLLLIKSIFFFMSFWGIAAVLLWFRPRVEIFWKIISSLIFIFYVWFFWSEISAGFNSLTLHWYSTSIDFIKETIALVFVNLFFLWPVVLAIVFYKADEIGAERLLKFMCILTIVLWIIFVVYVYFDRGIDDFFYEKLKEMIPGAK